jgi:excisionase family DNA binding protein
MTTSIQSDARLGKTKKPHPVTRASQDRSPESTEPFTVTIREAARVSGLSRSEIYRRLAAGDLKAIKSGARTLVLMESMKRYLASLPAAQFRPASKV